jgi:hypothetical protein
MGYLKFAREHEIKQLNEDRSFDLSFVLGGTKLERDDLGLPIEAKPSIPVKSGDQQ